MKMKFVAPGALVCLALSYLIIIFAGETDAKLGHVGWAKSDSRTKQILHNIRKHLAQQVNEAKEPRKCDPTQSSCEERPVKETEEDESEETKKPGRFRTRHKAPTIFKVKEATPRKDRKFLSERIQKKENEKKPKAETEFKFKLKKVKKEDDIKSRSALEANEKKDAKVENDTHVKLIGKQDSKLLTKKAEKSKQPTKTHESTPRRKAKDKTNEGYTRQEEPKTKAEFTPMKSDQVKRIKQKFSESSESDGDARFPEGIPVFSLASDAVKSELCRQHSQTYLRQLHRYKLWALMMYDATAKLPSGVLQGNVNQYGDFDQCLSVNATFKNRGKGGIQGKYCLATVDVFSDSKSASLQHAISRSQSYGFVKSKITDPGHFIPRFSTVNWGICIPSSCNAQDLETSVMFALDVYQRKSGLKFNVRVEDKNCITKEDFLSDSDARTVVTLFFCCVIAIAAYATFKDVRSEKSKVEKTEKLEGGAIGHGKLNALVMAFSFKRNAIKLFLNGESEDSIECVHGIKSVFTVMLYFAHKTILLSLTPFSNRVLLTEMSNEPISVLLRGSMIYTDSFLLLSGVLTSFNMAKELTRTGRVSWVRRVVARYVRLTPALLATLLLYAYVTENLGSGPVWNAVVGKNADLCRNHMWRNLLYIQNFFPFEDMCAPQTHQLALDAQLFLLSPLLVYALYEYDKIGIGILQALLMVSSILRFTATSNNQLSIVIYHGMPVSQLYETANLLYTQPVHRATPYIFGILIGYYLRKIGRHFRLPKAAVVSGWLACTVLGLLSFVAPAALARRDYEYDVSKAAHYAALSPISWSLALGWIIMACHLGYGGKLNEFLRLKGFLILSRLSYSVYLTQFIVFSHLVGVKRIPERFSIIGSLDATEFLAVASLSVAMTLLFDIPTVEIKKMVLNEHPYGMPTVSETKEGRDIVGTEIAEEKNIIPDVKAKHFEEAEEDNEVDVILQRDEDDQILNEDQIDEEDDQILDEDQSDEEEGYPQRFRPEQDDEAESAEIDFWGDQEN